MCVSIAILLKASALRAGGGTPPSRTPPPPLPKFLYPPLRLTDELRRVDLIFESRTYTTLLIDPRDATAARDSKPQVKFDCLIFVLPGVFLSPRPNLLLPHT